MFKSECSIQVIVVQVKELDLSDILKNNIILDIDFPDYITDFPGGIYKTYASKLSYLLLSYINNFGNPSKFIKLIVSRLEKINVKVNILFDLKVNTPSPFNNTPLIKNFLYYIISSQENFYKFIFGDDSYIQLGYLTTTDILPQTLAWWKNRDYKDLEDRWERRDKYIYRRPGDIESTAKIEYMLLFQDETFPAFPDNVKIFYNI